MPLTSSGSFARLKLTGAPVLTVRRLSVRYQRHDGSGLNALRDVHLNLHEGETVGVVGESGCGKSTLARTLVGLEPASAGAINFDGRDIATLSEEQWRPLRRQIQMVFQDPGSSLDPQMSVRRIVAEPLEALYSGMSGQERRARVEETIERVGLSTSLADRYPHELSGGQSQRVAIARALVVRPRVLICDEPVSALDASVQAQIINLLREIQRDSGLALLFISHDLAAVRMMSHRIVVMYLGRVMETADTDALFARPMHPYSQALIAALPGRGGGAKLLRGEVPDPRHPPSGCVFRTRCPSADARCAMAVPASRRTASGSVAACFYAPEPPPQVRLPEEEPPANDEDEEVL